MENFNRANEILIRNPFFVHKYFMQFCVLSVAMRFCYRLQLIRTWNYLGIVQWNDISERYRCGIERKI